MSSSQLRSHSELVGAHLGSALAHVDADVQRHALKAVDVAIQFAPDLVARWER